jgi:hypothetical protein
VRKQSFTRNSSFFALAGMLLSCAAQTGGVSTQCVVNADQASLFMGHWSSHPIPLAVEANDFSSSELAALEASIQTWNDFFTASKGFQLYLTGSSLNTVSNGGTRVTQSTVCSQTLVGPNGFTNSIMIYKTRSGWTYGSAIMALTSVCPIVVSGSTYKKYVSGVMEVNFQNYFNSGQPIPDLQSIVTHELGHMLGLGHSCDGASCTSTMPANYSAAMMYPSLGFNGTAGEVKRDLNDNDQERANCLY